MRDALLEEIGQQKVAHDRLSTLDCVSINAATMQVLARLSDAWWKIFLRVQAETRSSSVDLDDYAIPELLPDGVSTFQNPSNSLCKHIRCRWVNETALCIQCLWMP